MGEGEVGWGVAKRPGRVTLQGRLVRIVPVDPQAHAGRLYDAMAAHLGEHNVFMDVELAPGVDFVQRITDAVGGCHVLLVIIGPRWATLSDGGVSPRIVWADVIGSRGKTKVRGTTLRSRLGLYDTWAYFRRIKTNASNLRAGSSWLSRLVRTRELSGVVDPRPHDRLIVATGLYTGLRISELLGLIWQDIDFAGVECR